jgi:hypothetical protein
LKLANTTLPHSPFTIPHSPRAAFSLVELLTVIFIISLLIGILIPSIGAARNAAKKATTAKTIDAIKVGLEMFKNEQGNDFRQTNGYPPSFEHPPIPGYAAFDRPARIQGRFPFLADGVFPKITGAHWLPAMLMGVDNLGYLPRSAVPAEQNMRTRPGIWYHDDPFGDGRGALAQGRNLYLDPGGVKTRQTRELPGRLSDGAQAAFFPDWDQGAADLKMFNLPVIVDAFDQPILYYAANAFGRETNLVENARTEENEYTGGPQRVGAPYYFHQDNEGFTGTETQKGWYFQGDDRNEHRIARSGAEHTALDLIQSDPQFRNTFARFIVDRHIWTQMQQPGYAKATTPLRPVNADSFLLISAGPDGIYGTNDDVSNVPPFPD